MRANERRAHVRTTTTVPSSCLLDVVAQEQQWKLNRNKDICVEVRTDFHAAVFNRCCRLGNDASKEAQVRDCCFNVG